jgi:ABC-type nitrate/sulfonate/bicarbonate transport system substrate-binding protein
VRHRWLALGLGILTAVVGLPPWLAAAGPDAQQKGLRTVRFITFTVDPGAQAALSHGFFTAQGLEVEVTITPNSTFQMRGLGQGDFDIASTAFDNVLAWSGREGAEIVAILQHSRGVDLPLYVRPEIQDWDDLRGRPLAADAVDTAFALVLRRILEQHGLHLDRGDYELVAVGGTPARLESLRRGETFAAILSTDLEPAAQAAGLRRAGHHSEVVPDYPGGVYAVNRAWAEGNRDVVVRFLRGWLEGARWARANPAAARELLMSARGLTPDAAERALADLSEDGRLNPAGLQTALDLRLRYGYQLPMGRDLARFYDASFHAAAVQPRG